MCALFCKSLCVINVVSPYGLHGVPIYILYSYDQMWLVRLFCKVSCEWLSLLRVIISCGRYTAGQNSSEYFEKCCRRLKRNSNDMANNWPHVMPAFEYPAPGLLAVKMIRQISLTSRLAHQSTTPTNKRRQ